MSLFKFLIFTLPFLCGLVLPFLMAKKLRLRFLLLTSLVGPVLLVLSGLGESEKIVGPISALYLFSFEVVCASLFVFLLALRLNFIVSQVIVCGLVALSVLSVFFFNYVIDAVLDKNIEAAINWLLTINPFLVGCAIINEIIFTKDVMYLLSRISDYRWQFPEWHEPIVLLLVVSVVLIVIGYAIRKIFKTGNLALTW